MKKRAANQPPSSAREVFRSGRKSEAGKMEGKKSHCSAAFNLQPPLPEKRPLAELSAAKPPPPPLPFLARLPRSKSRQAVSLAPEVRGEGERRPERLSHED